MGTLSLVWLCSCLITAQHLWEQEVWTQVCLIHEHHRVQVEPDPESQREPLSDVSASLTEASMVFSKGMHGK